MAKGTRYTPEFKAKAVSRQAVDRVARLVFVGDQGDRTGRQGSGVAPETLRRWRNKTDATVAAETRQSAEDAMAESKSLRAEVARLRRANEILTTASAFFAARLDPTRR